MPQSGAELVREIIDALNRGDIAAVLERVHPDFEWRTLDNTPVAGTYRGHDEVRGYVEDWLATFDDLRIDIHEITESGDEVHAVVRGHARGRRSGIEVENHFRQVWTFHEGVPVQMQEHEVQPRQM